ncbi:MAG: SMC-Scp complex subunit ScpB [Anaerolineales bacterium]
MSESENPVGLSLPAQIEALLFVAVEPVTSGQLATVLETTTTQVNNALNELDASFRTRGLQLQRHNGRVQLTTAPETSEAIERFLGLEAITHLSRAALEALSIIAYQQPVTRPQVDSVRGVNSDGVMRTLLSKGLIQEGGRAEGPGRPILYHTAPEFLQHFGLNSLTELPPLERKENGQQDVSLLKG